MIVTPGFPHCHHSQADEAIDRHRPARFVLVDRASGTAVQPEREWPERHGLVDDRMSGGIARQRAFPFVWKG